jgi:hypothetical protein
MSGKDTHVRGLRVLGPLEYVVPFNDPTSLLSYTPGRHLPSMMILSYSSRLLFDCIRQSDDKYISGSSNACTVAALPCN